MLVWHDEQSLAAYAFGTVEQGSFHICITTGRCEATIRTESCATCLNLTLPVVALQRLAQIERSSCQLTLRKHQVHVSFKF